MSDVDCPGVSRARAMYGVDDVEVWVREALGRVPGVSMGGIALLVTELLAEATDLVDHDPVGAKQTLARAKFLILRHCPCLNPSKDEPTPEWCGSTTLPG